MSNATATPDPLADVSSFYGPGTLLGWVCTIIFVIINWSLNPEVRDTDTLTNDFLAMLVVPAIAAGHIVYLVVHDGTAIAQLAPDDPAVARYVTAVQAPLRTFMGFVVVIYCVASIAIQRCHRKRMVCCLSTGLIGAVGQFPLLVPLCWPPSARLSPYMFIFPSFTTMVVGLAGFWQFEFILVPSPPAAIEYLSARQVDLAQIATRGDLRPGFSCGQHWRMKKPYETCENCRVEVEVIRWADVRVLWPSQAYLIARSSSIFPLSFMLFSFYNGSVFNFLPESPNSILELDQMAALLLGLVTVWCTVREAVRSRRDNKGAEDDRRSGVEIAQDILKWYSAEELATLCEDKPPPPSSAGSLAG